MTQPSWRPFSRRADQLYERGVAAAQGGQRIIAAALLQQVVRLQPDHEQAWLWLSGVLDEREDVAFCLRAVLRINPHNERARMGLAQLDTWHASPGAAQASSSTQPSRLMRSGWGPRPVSQPWWSTWRTTRLAVRSLVVLLWLVPVVLLTITAGVRGMIMLSPAPQLVTYQDLLAPTTAPQETVATSQPEVVAQPSAVAIEPTQLAAAIPHVDPAVVEAYLAGVQSTRQQLQQAVAAYREATAQSFTSAERVAATRTLSEEIARGRSTLEALQPPPGMADAHATYLEGLTLGELALQDLLAYYDNADVLTANRAALRIQQANDTIASGTAGWETGR